MNHFTSERNKIHYIDDIRICERKCRSLGLLSCVKHLYSVSKYLNLTVVEDIRHFNKYNTLQAFIIKSSFP